MVSPKANDGEGFLPVDARRCIPFNYSEKVLLSVTDYEKKRDAEFLRVKNLTGKPGYWVELHRQDGAHYLNDPVTVLKGVGKAMAKKLSDASLKTVGDVRSINPETKEVAGVTRKKLRSIYDLASESINSNAPLPVDHRKAENPYVSKFGDEWETQLRKSSAFSHSIVITEYIQHMMEQSALVMKGTKHEESWYVYHDSLSIMTSAKTKEWMEKMGYLKRWILPTKNLYCDDPDLKKRYSDNPLDNSP